MQPARYRIIVLPTASADIEAAYEYVQADSTQHAVSLVKKLIGAIDSLEIFPRRCKVYHSHRSPSLIVRSLPVPPYVVYFRVFEADRVVQILSIRHGSRRPPSRFPT